MLSRTANRRQLSLKLCHLRRLHRPRLLSIPRTRAKKLLFTTIMRAMTTKASGWLRLVDGTALLVRLAAMHSHMPQAGSLRWRDRLLHPCRRLLPSAT
jgi:hypothetical protein